LEAVVPHRVIFRTEKPTEIEDLQTSLSASASLLRDVPSLLEDLIPGLEVQVRSITARSISQQSPLRQTLAASIFIAAQKDLEREISRVLERLFSVDVHAYDTTITVASGVLAIYGLDLLIAKIKGEHKEASARRQWDGLITAVSAETGVSKERIAAVLAGKYGGQRGVGLSRTALNFVRPSRRQGNVPIQIGSHEITSDFLSTVPSDADLVDLEPDPPSQVMTDVEIEIHAQDLDRPRRGWAGVIPLLSKKRLKMELMPPLRPETIYTQSRIRGDVIVLFKETAHGHFEPYAFHLIKIT
jgi:hypothetical protein